VVLPDEVLGDLKADLGGFLQSKQMYTEELGLPWRRGIMLFGLPGNGKTMLIRKTCEYFGLDHIDMDSLIDQSGTLQLDRAVRERDSIDGELYPEDQRPMVCVLEDIDKYTSFQSGEAEKDVGKISLHALLKGLDGVDEVSGIILFATTNFPDLLHEAIAGRPGRFDKIYEIKKPTPEGIIKLLNYHKISIVDGNLDQIVKELKGSSMAFVAEFIKSAKMKYKRNDLKTEEAKTLLDAIHHHQELCRKHFQEEKTLGFGK
jgi:SpoVK/Ycf46/Vps4 family AAA+-type ATPase